MFPVCKKLATPVVPLCPITVDRQQRIDLYTKKTDVYTTLNEKFNKKFDLDVMITKIELSLTFWNTKTKEESSQFFFSRNVSITSGRVTLAALVCKEIGQMTPYSDKQVASLKVAIFYSNSYLRPY
ncbi:MAG: hypothetical protein P0S95_07820 [Rhabdochlamydiaceae bacterium]|nr:hypothetical protein [Candidatus Amphrikana amoebophyrae]